MCIFSLITNTSDVFLQPLSCSEGPSVTTVLGSRKLSLEEQDFIMRGLPKGLISSSWTWSVISGCSNAVQVRDQVSAL